MQNRNVVRTGARHSRSRKGLALFFAVAMLSGVVETLASAIPAGASTLRVQASSESTDSGVTIASGHTVNVSADPSELWNVDPGRSATNAAGLGDPCAGNCIAPGQSYQSLVGSTDGGASWFEIGVGPTLVNGPGHLLLAADDGPGFYFDNTGYVDVTITPNQSGPTLSITSGMDASASATSAAGAPVTFTVPTAMESDEGTAPAVTCASNAPKQPGDVFPIGQTLLTCSASDAGATPQSVQTTLTITVTDTSLAITPGVDPPPVKALGPDMGAPVSFKVPTATDVQFAPAPVPVNCVPASGSWFDPGVTTVTCTASVANATPSSVSTTLTVNVFRPATVPGPPIIGTVTPGQASASVTFGPPVYDGSSPITSYSVTCAANDGTSVTASGPYSPISVTHLKGGNQYSCTARATNAIGTGDQSAASSTFAPGVGDGCKNGDTCHTASVSPNSSSSPPEKVDVKGMPSDPTGTVHLVVGSDPLNCPGAPPVVTPSATLTDTGFSSSTNLTVTLTLFAVATGPAKVCYSSTIPFLSESNPTTPKAGTGILLQCSAVAKKAPCLLSTSNTLSTVVATILVPGGDPTFSVVVPTGRLVWPSTFPNGKVGTAYSAHLLSKGGKAPFHWKISSGKLPPGLAIDAGTGTVTGKPTTKGTFKSVVHVVDSEAHPQSANISVSITIN